MAGRWIPARLRARWPKRAAGVAGAGRPTRLRSPFVSVVMHPFLVGATLLVVTVAASDFAADRPETFTAESTVVVGRIDVASNAVPGYVQANNTLAGTYSRFVGTDLHLREISRLTGLDPLELTERGGLDGSNIEQSSLIRVQATAADESTAVQLADAGALALVDLVNGVNDLSTGGSALLQEHAEAAARLAAAQAEMESYQRDLAFFLENALTTEAAQAERDLELARADFTVRQLEANTLSILYTQSQQSRASGELLRILNEAESFGSDRGSRLQLAVVVGVLGGLALGASLAYLATNLSALLAIRRSMNDEAAPYGAIPLPDIGPVRINGSAEDSVAFGRQPFVR